MFGCVKLKSLFRAPAKRYCNVRPIDIPCHVSNNAVVSGRFIYLLQDNTIQVASGYTLSKFGHV